jgi:hypothetical protein
MILGGIKAIAVAQASSRPGTITERQLPGTAANWKSRPIAVLCERLVTVSPRKGKAERRATMRARHNVLKTGDTRTMPNHTLMFIEPARLSACAGVLAWSRCVP